MYVSCRSLRLYYHLGECVVLHPQTAQDTEELAEIAARLAAVTTGCDSQVQSAPGLPGTVSPPDSQVQSALSQYSQPPPPRLPGTVSPPPPHPPTVPRSLAAPLIVKSDNQVPVCSRYGVGLFPGDPGLFPGDPGLFPV